MVMSRVYERPKYWPSLTPIKGYMESNMKHKVLIKKFLQKVLDENIYSYALI